jgi:hypothetical protein
MPDPDRLDDELADMQRRSRRLEEDIDATKRDWERKKADDAVPGAAGDPERAAQNPPETDFPNRS